VTPAADLLVDGRLGAPTADPPAPLVEPRLPFERVAEGLRRAPQIARDAAGDDWPRTSRILPWMIAGFIFMLWLVPFNSISLGASGPIDLHLDRLVAPPIILVWLLTVSIGGPGVPRIRMTPIHGALFAFVGLAFLSIVLNAHALNLSLTLDQALKRVSLLVTYMAMFVVIASTIRRSEVRAFMRYTLVLAVLLAVGILWEFHFVYNVFYSWSGKLLPGPFEVSTFDPAGVDEIGRRQTRGSAELGLEATAMLAMALPIAFVGIMHAKRHRARILYALAACVIMAAAISTYRKTAIIAPLAVLLTLAIFRRRELLKLTPLAIVLIVVVHALSPGALGAITDQLHSNRLAAAQTVDDRVSDYDAIRPDVLTAPAMGHGWGSYEERQIRILDSEVLHRLVETGVVGLIAYFGTLFAIIFTARRAIRARDRWSPEALAAACAAAAFITVSYLYDSMSFPHGPYIVLCMGAFVAIIAKPPEEPAE
jgi:O-antigen ligase